MEYTYTANKKRNLIFMIAFIVLWGGIALANLLTPQHDFSEAENRKLSAFPEFSVELLLDGEFMDDVNVWLNDQFIARPLWVSSQSLIEYGSGKREIKDVYLAGSALLKDNSPPNKPASDANITGINAFSKRFPDIPVTVMLVPDSTPIMSDSLPPFATTWDEKSYIGSVYGGLADGIKTVDAYTTLDAHKEEYIYYRTDHHWTSYGAYLAYSELAKTMGFAPSAQDEMDFSTLSTEFYGTNHSRTGFPLVKPDIMVGYQSGEVLSYEVCHLENNDYTTLNYDSIYFEDYLSKKDKYSYFFGPLEPYVTIKTTSDSGKKLIIFKDSFAHCLAPMLLSEYSEIRLVDLRAVADNNPAAFVESGEYDEALFLYSVDTFSQQMGPGKLAR